MKELKVVFPTNDLENVESHFGHCSHFKIFNIKEGKIKESEVIKAPHHEPGVFPKFLGELKVNTIITGSMGQRAIELFKEQNIQVILGANGKIEDILNIYLEGELYSTGEPCKHEHH